MPTIRFIDKDSSKTIAAELEYITTLGCEIVNERDWDAVGVGKVWRDRIAPHFRASFSHLNREDLNYDDLVTMYKELIRQHPEHHISPMKFTTEVDVTKGVANVYIDLSIVAKKGEVSMQGFNWVEWKLMEVKGEEEMKWMVTKLTSMRANPF